MTNTIAITLLVGIGGLVLADQVWLHADLPMMAARTTDAFIEYLSFWR